MIQKNRPSKQKVNADLKKDQNDKNNNKMKKLNSLTEILKQKRKG
jgi:hypothetical protein